MSIRSPEDDEDEVDWYVIRHVYEEVLAALDAERLGTATADDIELLDEEADSVALDWGDEYKEEGMDTKELRGMKAGPGASRILQDSRIVKVRRLQEFA
jgi:hypothetical protein